jgi:hypothetical protein
MKKLLLLAIITAITALNAIAQNNVGIGTTTPNAKAILDLQATNKGLLVPRMTTVQMNSVATNSTTNGLLVYNTDLNCFHYWNTSTSTWKSMCASTGIINSGDTVIINLLKVDSAFIKNLFSTYIKADSAYIKLLRTDTIIGGFGKFDSLYVGGQNILQTISDSITAQAWLLKGNVTTNNNKLGTLNARNLHIITNNTERISVMSATGNVGIGQLLASAKLDVLGNIQFFGDLKPAGTAGTTGQVLTSSGIGVAPTWTSVSTLVPATTVSNTLTGTNLTTTVNGVTGAPIDLSTIASATTVSNTYNTTTGALSTTVNGVTGVNVTLPTAQSIKDSVINNAWLLKGNVGTTAGTNFIGTTDNVDVVFKRNGMQAGLLNVTLGSTSLGVGALNPLNTGTSNTAIGIRALTTTTIGSDNTATGFNSLLSNTTGNNNTAIGSYSMYSNTTGLNNTAMGTSALSSNTTGRENVAVGTQALSTNTIGQRNTATGYYALGNNLTGLDNTATGHQALFSNTTGLQNVAIGSQTLYYNTTGNTNTATGSQALQSNTTGSSNIATGAFALFSNTTGGANTASGYEALFNNTIGGTNTATGFQALQSNTTGGSNVATGFQALQSNTTGDNNSATGVQALYNNTTGFQNAATGSSSLYSNTTGNNNTATGINALHFSTTGAFNTATGVQALYSNTTGNNNVAVGFLADVSIGTLTNGTSIGTNSIVNASNKVRLGDATVTVVEGPVAYTVSDGRFKTNITEEVQGLAFINKLRPVVYNFDTRKFDEFLTKNMSDSIRQARMKNQDYKPSTAIRQSGFIAQEVEQAAKAIGYNFNGVHVPENENDNYSVSYQTIVVPLVKAVQELNEQNKLFKQQNELLLKRIEILEKK